MNEMVFCRTCGEKIHKEAVICPHCGVPQTYPSSRNKVIAALLALFLGGLGAHKFYLGKPIQELLYLIFCWTFIPSAIAFVEFIIYLCLSDETFARKYG